MLHTLRQPDDPYPIERVHLSPDGRAVVATRVLRGGTLVWDARSGAHRLKLDASDYGKSVAFVPQQSLALVTDTVHGIALVDTERFELVATLRGLRSVVSDDGTVLAYEENDGTIGDPRHDVLLHDLAAREALGALTEAGRPVAFDPTRRLLVTTGSDLHIWDVAGRRRIHVEEGLEPVAFLPSGLVLACLRRDGVVWLLRLDDGGRPRARVAQAAIETEAGDRALVFTPDGRFDGDPSVFDHLMLRAGADLVESELIPAVRARPSMGTDGLLRRSLAE